jgi:phospholipid/cholesterol/gamma-HCH transport system substrate-binding protein
MADQTETSTPMPASRGKYREVWVGLFVILGTLITLITLMTLTNPSMFRGRYVVTTNVQDAGGIRKGDPVVLRGVNIGRIQGFYITSSGVAITLEIEGEYSIPVGSHVELRQNSVLGSVYADVVPGTSTQMMKNGESLPGSRPAGLYDAMGELKDDAQGVLTQARSALSPETVGNIQSSAKEMNQLLAELRSLTSEQRKELRDLTASLKKTAQDIDGLAGRPEFDRSIKRLDTLSARLEDSTASLKRSGDSLETVLARIERGEGTLGKLSKDEALYNNLNEAVGNINKLVDDVRKQPKKYLKLSLF